LTVPGRAQWHDYPAVLTYRVAALLPADGGIRASDECFLSVAVDLPLASGAGTRGRA
jgi:hypothetical protein